jgi:hypothetical protein
VLKIGRRAGALKAMGEERVDAPAPASFDGRQSDRPDMVCSGSPHNGDSARMTANNTQEGDDHRLAWAISGRFKSTLFPLFDVYTLNQEPQGE